MRPGLDCVGCQHEGNAPACHVEGLQATVHSSQLTCHCGHKAAHRLSDMFFILQSCERNASASCRGPLATWPEFPDGGDSRRPKEGWSCLDLASRSDQWPQWPVLHISVLDRLKPGFSLPAVGMKMKALQTNVLPFERDKRMPDEALSAGKHNHQNKGKP